MFIAYHYISYENKFYYVWIKIILDLDIEQFISYIAFFFETFLRKFCINMNIYKNTGYPI